MASTSSFFFFFLLNEKMVFSVNLPTLRHVAVVCNNKTRYHQDLHKAIITGKTYSLKRQSLLKPLNSYQSSCENCTMTSITKSFLQSGIIHHFLWEQGWWVMLDMSEGFYLAFTLATTLTITRVWPYFSGAPACQTSIYMCTRALFLARLNNVLK